MKKIIYLLTILSLMSPAAVNAAVDSNTPIGLFPTETECRRELAKNDKSGNRNATTGYYLSCIAVGCGINSRITHQDVEPFEGNVICANGNTDPYKKSWKTAVPTEGELAIGKTCSLDEDDDNFIAAQYATEISQYNCLQKRDGSIYEGVNNPGNNNNTTGNNNNTNTGNGEIKNPETGVDTYYVVLGSTVVILSLGLYVINKKNIFKKI